MADYQPDQPRDHEFDGIVEYDNKVPAWLQGFFNLSVLFAVVYLAYYWLGPGKMGAEELESKLNEEQQRIQVLEAAAGGGESGPSLVALSHDKERIAAGKEIYAGKGICGSCHGPDGLGLVGPNLRDDGWIYGSDMETMVDVIAKGRLQMGMPPAQLSKDEIISVAAFIADWNRTQKANGQGVTKGDRETSMPIEY